ncbi:MAG: hypothetical protein GY730_10165 [bacterium]|nr:hypothetical protein [bacterium]
MKEFVINIIITAVPIVITATLAGLGWLYKHEREKRLLAEQQLFDKKYAFYAEILEFFFRIMQGKSYSDEKTKSKMWEFNKGLYLYASHSVLTNYQDWMYENRNYKSQNSNSVKKLLNGVCKIIIAIREDMVHEKKQINNESILKHLLVDYDISKEKGIL